MITGQNVIPTDIDPDAPEPVMPEIPALPDDAPTPGLGAEPELPAVPDVESKEAVKEKAEDATEEKAKDAAAE
jgi:hypothetical protein